MAFANVVTRVRIPTGMPTTTEAATITLLAPFSDPIVTAAAVSEYITS